MTIRLTVSDELQLASDSGIDQLVSDRFASRLLRKDASLWDEAAKAESARRLGWVDPFALSSEVLGIAEQLRDELREREITQVVLCGMGGSSLGSEVIAREAGVTLHVLDSTHPDVIRRALGGELAQTIVVISSKSGSTLETRTHAEFFRGAFAAAGLNPAEHMMYVTDPGSALDAYGDEGYRIVHADPTIGGRFSALAAFGIVPTVLAGADTGRLLADAAKVHPELFLDTPDNPALRLAAAIAGALPEQYILLVSEHTAQPWGLGDWVEQLVAESTGKEGKGVLPIALSPDAYHFPELPANAIQVRIGAPASESRSIGIEGALGAQMLLWEVATAALGRLMGINPFDQPDVEAAKIAAHTALEEGDSTIEVDAASGDEALIEQLRAALPRNGYLCIQAFLDRDSAKGAAALALSNRIASELQVPVALGWGPRYLHSTGQLHKGGPALGVYLQLVDATAAELPIPGQHNGTAELLRAQARGDREVLRSRGRAVVTRAV